MIRLIVADDHPLILNGVVSHLQQQKDVEIIGKAKNGPNLLKLILSTEADIVLCDINMPGLDGFEVMKAIIDTGTSPPKFIFLSVHDEKPVIEKAFRLGAYGYLLKSSDPNEIVEAIERVTKGKKYFSDEVMNITLSPTTEFNDDFALLSQLSEREIEIIKLVVDGLSNAQIGEKLFISKRTVDTHRNNVLQKLNLKNTAQLVRYAIKSGLVD